VVLVNFEEYLHLRSLDSVVFEALPRFICGPSLCSPYRCLMSLMLNGNLLRNKYYSTNDLNSRWLYGSEHREQK